MILHNLYSQVQLDKRKLQVMESTGFVTEKDMNSHMMTSLSLKFNIELEKSLKDPKDLKPKPEGSKPAAATEVAKPAVAKKEEKKLEVVTQKTEEKKRPSELLVVPKDSSAKKKGDSISEVEIEEGDCT